MTPHHTPIARKLSITLSAIALACTTSGCAADTDLAGPAPTPFWLDGGDTTTDSSGDGAGGANDSDATQAALADSVTSDTATVQTDAASDAAAVDSANGQTDQYFVSWLETAAQLQDPSPFGDSWAEQRTFTLGLVKVQWNGSSGMRWHQPCAMHTTANFSTKTLYSSAFLASIPVEPTAIERQGTAWSQAEELQVIGLQPGYSGAMPGLGEKGHAAVVDSDKDGLPGATIHIDNSLLGKQSIQVVQRSKTSWAGTVQANGDVTAIPQVLSEQVVIGASMSLLVTKNNVKPLQGKPAETLLWRPLGEPIDCKALLAEPKKYAGRAWPP